MKKIIVSFVLFFIMGIVALPDACAKIAIVAAENFYGSMAKQIGGPYVTVTSILNNPNQDPHLFSAVPSTAKALAAAQIVVYSGADYDLWMNRLLNADDHSKVSIINVGELAAIKSGENPHIWYNPNYMLLYVSKLTHLLTILDPHHQAYYQKQRDTFRNNNRILLNEITKISKKTNGMVVTATEPVFGYMANLLGFTVLDLSFQWEIMNDASPSPKEIEAYENNLRDKKVKILFYNNQVIDPLTKEIKQIAIDNNVPIIGVSETLPAEYLSYHQWMSVQLAAVKKIINIK